MKRSNVDKRRRNTLIAGIVIIVLMITSVLGLFASQGEDGSSDKFEYNGYKFYLGNQGWFTRINNQQVIFNFRPQDVENISIPAKLVKEVDKIYLVQDQDPDLYLTYPSDRLKSIFYYFTDVRIQDACIEEEGCDVALPIVSCEGGKVQVIHFKLGNSTENYVNQACLVLQINASNKDDVGKIQEEIYKVNERLVYSILDIM